VGPDKRIFIFAPGTKEGEIKYSLQTQFGAPGSPRQECWIKEPGPWCDYRWSDERRMAALVDFIRALAWPLVVAGGLWYYRNEIRVALKRLTAIGPTGAKFDPSPEHQIPSTPTLAAELPPPKADALTPQPDLQTQIQQIKSLISADQLDPFTQKLRADLSGVSPSQQLEALPYFVAALGIQLSHERNYIAIFGSQLNLLAQANGASGITPELANALYEQAKAAYPQVYAALRLDQWIGFLITAGLLIQSGGAYVLTSYGRGFIKYLVDRQLPVNKPF
jgi:hypothetical protein